MVFGPALGSYIMESYNTSFVVLVASLIAILNVFFIMVVVPESLPYKHRTSTNSISWKKADPFVVSYKNTILQFFVHMYVCTCIYIYFFFKALRMVGRDRTILILCLTVFLSYLPEAGEYSSLFVYLRLVSNKTKKKYLVIVFNSIQS